MTPREFEQQLEDIQKTQPGLSGCASSDGFQISGRFILNHSANGIPLYEEYSIQIEIPSSFPDSFPKVMETSGLIPEGFDHVNPDKYLCLAANCEIAALLDKTPTLVAFIDELVTSYLYSAAYYAKYRICPFGERPHGIKGLKVAYADRYAADTDDVLLPLLGYVSGKLAYRGHTPCPCHSGKRLRECHGKVALADIKSPRCAVYRDDATLILYDMYCDWREKNGK